MPDGNDEAQFIELADGTEPSGDQLTQATEWLSKADGFDPKTIEGKPAIEVWNAARAAEAAQRSTPWKGTPWEGLKVPDKFVKDGKVNAGDLLKSYTEIEKAQGRRRDEVLTETRAAVEAERLAAAPAAPGDYTVPEKFKLGDHEITIKGDDPMFEFFRSAAHEMKIPQASFDKFAQGFVAAQIAAMPSWENEAKALGPLAEQRLTRVDGFMRGSLSKESYAQFSAMPATAERVKAFEEIMTLAGHPPIGVEGSAMPGERYTREQLKEMQNDPRYTGENGKMDRNFVQKVRAGFKMLNG